MTRAVLTRGPSTVEGTFGSLRVILPHVEIAFHTGELPWRDNAHEISCIPIGSYRCAFTFSPRFKRKTYELLEVPDRTAIRIHPANRMGDETKGFQSELNGCIALGENVGFIEGQRAILRSAAAIARLERELDGAEFTLEIRDGGGERP